MRLTKTVGILTGAAALALTGVGYAATSETDAQRDARLAELEAQVAQLRAEQGEQWLTEERAKEIRSLVQDVLNDADTRASLQGSGMTAGWDKGFFLGSADGKFRLNINGLLQVRWMMRYDDSDSEDHWRTGFDNFRTELMFSGHIIDPSWQYKVRGEFLASDQSSGNAGDFSLTDAYIRKNLDDNWNVQVGQYKIPFNYEDFIVEDWNQQFVARSLINDAFSVGRSQGVMVGWESDVIRAWGMYGNGRNTTNQFATAYDTEFALGGRVQGKLAGNWKQFDEYTSWRGQDFGLLLGGGMWYQKQEYGVALPSPKAEQFTWTVDGTAQFGGFNVAGAFYGQHNQNLGPGDFDAFGATLQGGVFITDDWELVARGEWGDDDNNSTDDLWLITLGTNYYFAKQSLKFSADVGYAIDGVPSFFSSPDESGWLGSAQDDDQLVLRTQMQLMF